MSQNNTYNENGIQLKASDNFAVSFDQDYEIMKQYFTVEIN